MNKISKKIKTSKEKSMTNIKNFQRKQCDRPKKFQPKLRHIFRKL